VTKPREISPETECGVCCSTFDAEHAHCLGIGIFECRCTNYICIPCICEDILVNMMEITRESDHRVDIVPKRYSSKVKCPFCRAPMNSDALQMLISTVVYQLIAYCRAAEVFMEPVTKFVDQLKRFCGPGYTRREIVYDETPIDLFQPNPSAPIKDAMSLLRVLRGSAR
jgi:hypothetical protein